MSDTSAPLSPLPQTSVRLGAGETTALLLFRVAGRWFAIEANLVQEVVVKGAITRVPTAPRHVMGIVGLRGGVVPVVSLEHLLAELVGPSAAVASPLPRLVVLRADGYEIALVVDEIRGIIDSAPPVYATETKAVGHASFLNGEFEWRGIPVGRLDLPRLVAVATGRSQGSD